MPISEIEAKKAEMALRKYCEQRSDPAFRDELELVYRMEGNLAFLAERRPSWGDPSVKDDHDVARFRFVVKDRRWRLYWSDSNLKWHEFPESKPSADLSDFFPVINSDPIFYG